MTDYHIKYRPQTLDDVCGQKPVVDSLRAIIEKRSSHSFLFVGPSGVGKTTLARIVANNMGCKNSILEVDAASHSGVDSMRDIVKLMDYCPIASTNKAVIVDECHSLSKAAWQSVLKAIEEPPEYMFWFFCTTEAGRVPRTVKTRTVSFDLTPIRIDDIYDRLKIVASAENMVLSDDILGVVAEFAQGSLREALVGLSQVEGAHDPADAAKRLKFARVGDETVDFMRFLYSGQGLTWAEVMRRLDALGDFDPESLRIGIVNYLAVPLAKTTDNAAAMRILRLMSCFTTPFNPSTAKADLMICLANYVFSDR